MITLTVKQISLLKHAIDEADAWRGAITGNTGPQALAAHDKFIADARTALKAVKEMNAQAKGLNK